MYVFDIHTYIPVNTLSDHAIYNKFECNLHVIYGRIRIASKSYGCCLRKNLAVFRVDSDGFHTCRNFELKSCELVSSLSK